MIAVGWCGMITGQSVVLYSRLHLVVQDYRILRAVLIMIVTNALICHVPILVLLCGANSHKPGPYIKPYSIFEKVQITVFFLQEVLISSLYIWSTWVALKPGGNMLAKDLRVAMKHLIWINVAIVLLDFTLLATEYSGHYEIQVLYKAALYSAKLKMEFRILNQLVSLTKTRSPREWSYEHSSRMKDSTGHDLHTFAGRYSEGPRTTGVTELVPIPDAHGLAISVNHTSPIVLMTTSDLKRSRFETVLDSDTDRGKRESLDITCKTNIARTNAIPLSWSEVGLAR